MRSTAVEGPAVSHRRKETLAADRENEDGENAGVPIKPSFGLSGIGKRGCSIQACCWLEWDGKNAGAPYFLLASFEEKVWDRIGATRRPAAPALFPHYRNTPSRISCSSLYFHRNSHHRIRLRTPTASTRDSVRAICESLTRSWASSRAMFELKSCWFATTC